MRNDFQISYLHTYLLTYSLTDTMQLTAVDRRRRTYQSVVPLCLIAMALFTSSLKCCDYHSTHTHSTARLQHSPWCRTLYELWCASRRRTCGRSRKDHKHTRWVQLPEYTWSMGNRSRRTDLHRHVCAHIYLNQAIYGPQYRKNRQTDKRQRTNSEATNGKLKK